MTWWGAATAISTTPEVPRETPWRWLRPVREELIQTRLRARFRFRARRNAGEHGGKEPWGQGQDQLLGQRQQSAAGAGSAAGISVRRSVRVICTRDACTTKYPVVVQASRLHALVGRLCVFAPLRLCVEFGWVGDWIQHPASGIEHPARVRMEETAGLRV